MMDIDFVYFDLDDTLLDHRRAQDRALADLHGLIPSLSALPLEEVRATYARVNGRVWREYAAGNRDKEGTRSGRFELLFEALGLAEDPMAAADEYLTAYGRHWTLKEGALEALRHIGSILPTGVLTNGFAEAQRAKLARFPEMTSVFASIVISEEEGVLKPHPKLFQVAAERAGAEPARIAYVGDSLTSDVEGGLRAGWQVIWFTEGDPSDAPSVPRFSRWADLPGILGLSPA